jgi:hypothetical protein
VEDLKKIKKNVWKDEIVGMKRPPQLLRVL